MGARFAHQAAPATCPRVTARARLASAARERGSAACTHQGRIGGDARVVVTNVTNRTSPVVESGWSAGLLRAHASDGSERAACAVSVERTPHGLGIETFRLDTRARHTQVRERVVAVRPGRAGPARVREVQGNRQVVGAAVLGHRDVDLAGEVCPSVETVIIGSQLRRVVGPRRRRPLGVERSVLGLDSERTEANLDLRGQSRLTGTVQGDCYGDVL